MRNFQRKYLLFHHLNWFKDITNVQLLHSTSLQFSIIMIVVLLAEVGLGIAAFVRKDWVEGAIELSLSETLSSTKNDEALMLPWDKLQNKVSLFCIK